MTQTINDLGKKWIYVVDKYEEYMERTTQKKAKTVKKTEKKTLLRVEGQNSAVLLRKRSESMLHGMYQYVLLDGYLSEEECAGILMDMGLQVIKACSIKGYSHVFSHRIWDMKAYDVQVKGELLDKGASGYDFYSPEERAKLAIPRAFIWVEKEDKECK